MFGQWVTHWRWGLVAFLLTPIILLAWYLYLESGAPIFWDGRTIPCGLEAVSATRNPNAYMGAGFGGSCDGYGFAYTLPPWITLFMLAVVDVIGLQGLNLAYVVLYVAGLLSLLLLARRYHGSLGLPLAFAVLVGNGAYVLEAGSGNVATLLVCLVCVAIMLLPRWSAASIAAPMLAAMFKPHLALYLFVPVAARLPWIVISGAVFMLAMAYASDLALHPEAFDRWWLYIMPDTYADRSFGIIGVMQLFGVEFGQWGLQLAVAGLWATAVLLVGLWVLNRMTRIQDRAMFALLCAILMLPRIKEYDCFALIPIVFWQLSYLDDAWRDRYRQLLLWVGMVIPCLWWWLKLGYLVVQNSPLTLRAAVDLHWHYRTQGAVLAAIALLSFVVMVLSHFHPRQEGITASATAGGGS